MQILEKIPNWVRFADLPFCGKLQGGMDGKVVRVPVAGAMLVRLGTWVSVTFTVRFFTIKASWLGNARHRQAKVNGSPQLGLAV